MDNEQKLPVKQKGYAVVVRPVARFAMVAMGVASVFAVSQLVGVSFAGGCFGVALVTIFVAWVATTYTMYHRARSWDTQTIDRICVILGFGTAAGTVLFFLGMRFIYGYDKVAALAYGFMALIYFSSSVLIPLLFVGMKKQLAERKRSPENVTDAPAETIPAPPSSLPHSDPHTK